MKSTMFGIYDINDYFDFKTRLDIYKQVGFQEVALYLDNGYMKNNENYVDIISYARKIGLCVKQVHIDYKISNFICDETTDVYFEYLEEKLKECEKLQIPYVVAHASKGDNPKEISSVQIEKLRAVTERHANVTLCMENVRNNTNLEKIVNGIKNVKVCFDLGHAHAYANETQLFEKFKDEIQCSHLHNNFGKDTHNALSNGEINYKIFLEKLSKIENSSNCLECFISQDTPVTLQDFVNFVKMCYHDISNV